jgi:hypothetical protein
MLWSGWHRAPLTVSRFARGGPSLARRAARRRPAHAAHDSRFLTWVASTKSSRPQSQRTRHSTAPPARRWSVRSTTTRLPKRSPVEKSRRFAGGFPLPCTLLIVSPPNRVDQAPGSVCADARGASLLEHNLSLSRVIIRAKARRPRQPCPFASALRGGCGRRAIYRRAWAPVADFFFASCQISRGRRVLGA